jgi:hypothetical protein
MGFGVFSKVVFAVENTPISPEDGSLTQNRLAYNLIIKVAKIYFSIYNVWTF